MPKYLSTKETAARLGISRQTLYAYVSRGLLQSLPSDIPRESRYLESEVEQLALKRSRGRKSKDVAKATLDWGFPVLESSISLIQDQHLYYRGLDAIALAQTMTLEDVAAHLWQMSKDTAFGDNQPIESTRQAALSKLPLSASNKASCATSLSLVRILGPLHGNVLRNELLRAAELSFGYWPLAC
ncbi:citrate synthase [Pseudomonas sp. TH34]|uniref:helix-turn-helix domain-containing protein n=1 Tax=Pseudomonas sp. TH34 TaxID=2796399 RepID=UPI001912C2E5|nr:helix-turn-helix domain-containing protein [Pseudomonas sp. TH34]MBK5410810.1 citrate synthase [Pseudomonas sp. TH34]